MKIKRMMIVALVAFCCIAAWALPVKAVTINVSDETELRDALATASPGTEINFTADIYLVNTIAITAGIEVTFSGNYSLFGPDGQHTISVEETGILRIDGITVSHKPGESGVGIYIGLKSATNATEDGTVIIMSGAVSGNTIGIYNNKGTLRIEGGTISNNISNGQGGGVSCSSAGVVYMSGGSIRNNQAANGGGIITNGPFYFSGGEISGNTAIQNGGGIYAAYASAVITMSGGSVTNNNAGILGGGVILGANATMRMSGGTIANNTAAAFGGGVLLSDSTLEMTGGSLNGNQGSDGGGIFLNTASTFTTSGNVAITNNKAIAADGEGGGIYANSYASLNIGAQTYFNGNTAYRAFNPPNDAETSYSNIRFSHLSIATHALNNFDINYQGADEPVLVIITYHPNGGSGGASLSGVVRSISVATAVEAGVSRAGHILLNWNTAEDGSGTTYALGTTINLDNNLTLYAQWQLLVDSPNTGDTATMPWVVLGFALFALVSAIVIKRTKAIK